MPTPDDKTIPQLPPADELAEDDLLAVAQESGTRHCTAGQVWAGARPPVESVMPTLTVKLEPTSAAFAFPIATFVELSDGSVTFELPADATVTIIASFYIDRHAEADPIGEVRIDGWVKIEQPGRPTFEALMTSVVLGDPHIAGLVPPELSVTGGTVCGVTTADLVAGRATLTMMVACPFRDGDGVRWNGVPTSRVVVNSPVPVSMVNDTRITEDGITRLTEDSAVRITQGVW